MTDIEQKTITLMKKRIKWLNRLQNDTIMFMYSEFLDDTGTRYWNELDESDVNVHLQFKSWLEWTISKDNPWCKALDAKRTQEHEDDIRTFVHIT